MSCTEKLEQQLSFSELKAKFGSTNGTSDAGTDNRKTENENNANTVAAKKSSFY